MKGPKGPFLLRYTSCDETCRYFRGLTGSQRTTSFGASQEEKKRRTRRRREEKKKEGMIKKRKGMELVWFWVWKLRFLYGLYGLLWVGVNLWTFI